MKTLSTPALCKKSLVGIKTGRTVPELAAKTGATTGTARRSINRLILRGEAKVLNTRKCRETGKVLTAYSL
jgi:hypothetical protein